MDKLILVFYVGIGNLRPADIAEELARIKRRVLPSEEEGIISIVIPTKGETKVECLNPKFISEEESKELFNSHLEKLKKAHKEINEFLNHKK